MTVLHFKSPFLCQLLTFSHWPVSFTLSIYSHACLFFEQANFSMVSTLNIYSKRILQVIVTWLHSQIDQMHYSVVPPPNHQSGVVQHQHTALLLLHSQELNLFICGTCCFCFTPVH